MTVMSTQIDSKISLLKSTNNGRKPLIIAGPCSAESKEQLLETGIQLFKSNKVDIIRAGIWKPRTRPNSFEGVGTTGLPWMQKLKSLTGMPVAVEVAKASHVQLCLEFDIDVLWIGARTTVNPFAVQEIADALKGVDIPVLVKNPINPDISLWLGAIERLEKVGVKEIGAIHRGFSNFGEKIYRNRPTWQIPIEFKRRRPEIPMICDPSHICGKRSLLRDVAQQALDINYDGLMIESHIDPQNAWSDAAQQVTPDDFTSLIESLVLREDHEDDTPVQDELDRLRQDIDHIDDELINLLGNRMKISREIGAYKKENNITILQQKRWNDIVERCKRVAQRSELSEEFVMKFFNSVHVESIDHQEKVMNQSD